MGVARGALGDARGRTGRHSSCAATSADDSGPDPAPPGIGRWSAGAETRPGRCRAPPRKRRGPVRAHVRARPLASGPGPRAGGRGGSAGGSRSRSTRVPGPGGPELQGPLPGPRRGRRPRRRREPGGAGAVAQGQGSGRRAREATRPEPLTPGWRRSAGPRPTPRRAAGGGAGAARGPRAGPGAAGVRLAREPEAQADAGPGAEAGRVGRGARRGGRGAGRRSRAPARQGACFPPAPPSPSLPASVPRSLPRRSVVAGEAPSPTAPVGAGPEGGGGEAAEEGTGEPLPWAASAGTRAAGPSRTLSPPSALRARLRPAWSQASLGVGTCGSRSGERGTARTRLRRGNRP